MQVSIFVPTDRVDQECLQLARRLWIMEMTRRLDLMSAGKGESRWTGISEVPLVAIEPIYTPDVAPVLERIVTESTWIAPFDGNNGVVGFYLSVKTGREYTFVDIGGRTHPGGWNPSREP